MMHGRSDGGRSIAPAIVSIALFVFGCSKDSGTAPGDTTPPAAVKNLVAIDPQWDRVKLVWTAPGDDGNTGTAARYDIRYSKDPLTDDVWPAASQAAGEPSPRAAGSLDTFVVTGIDQSTTYYFALKTADGTGNWSSKSNITSAPTPARPDDTPPATVLDLAAASATTASVTLAWTAPGDDGAAGTAALYDIRYSKFPIDDTNWAYASQAGGEPAPHAAGSAETFEVTSLAPGTIYYFALKTADEKPNWSALSNLLSKATLTP